MASQGVISWESTTMPGTGTASMPQADAVSPCCHGINGCQHDIENASDLLLSPCANDLVSGTKLANLGLGSVKRCSLPFAECTTQKNVLSAFSLTDWLDLAAQGRGGLLSQSHEQRSQGLGRHGM